MINDDTSGMSQVQRNQNNFDERLFLEFIRHPESVSFLECLAPTRSPQKCERYTVPELTPVHSDIEGRQVLISETSTISDVKSRLRQLRQRRDELHQEYQRDLRSYWSRLLKTNPKQVVYWKKTSTLAFRKAKWKKVPTGTSKLVVKFVYLKPRPVHVVRRGVDFGTIMIRPRVRRELLVPIYQRVQLRAAGFRRVTVRTRVVKDGFDWPKIRASYVVYKIERRARLDADVAGVLVSINNLLKTLRRRMQSPHKLVAYTTLGWVPPSWEEYYYQHHRSAGHYEEIYGHMLPYEFRTELVSSGGASASSQTGASLGHLLVVPLFMGYRSLVTKNLEQLRSTVRDLGINIPVNAPDSFRAKDMLYPRTVVDRLVLLDSGVNPASRDEQNEALAASAVRSLRNGGDYVFNLPRSIGELKDSKATFRQAFDFMRWFGRGTRTRLPLPQGAKAAAERVLSTTGSASLAIVSAYLTWKFAIQPTIQDCVTFREHSKEWLLATRRQLMESIAILKKSSSNILHIRSRFRGDDAVRQRSLMNIAEDVESRDEVVELTSWARFDPPRMFPIQIESGLSASASFDLSNEPISGFEPSYRLEAEPATGSSYFDGSDVRYTLTGSMSGGSISGVIDVGDPGLEPRSFSSSSMPFEYRGVTRSDLVGLRYPSDIRDRQAEALEQATWPRVNTTGYVKNQVEGVVFARYQLQDLLEFLDYDNQNNSLETLRRLFERVSDWDGLLDGSYQEAIKGAASSTELVSDSGERARVLASFDTIYVAWQLSPLSFIYDWITTSDSVVTRLNNFLTEYSVPAPPAMDGVWVTRRVELLAGRPKLELDPEDRMSTSYVSDWYGGMLTCTCAGTLPPPLGHRRYSDWSYWAFPKRVVTTHRLRYASDTKVSLARSGLYAAKRGEYLDGGWETFLPQVRIKLNANKVGTLLGILAGFIAPKQ